MKFNELKHIKETVQRIYDEKHYPRSKVISYNAQIFEGQAQCFSSPPYYSAQVPYLQKVIEDLVEVKKLDNRKELFKTYADFGKELFNNSMSNLSSARSLLKERLDEIETTYFMQTTPVMKFLVHDEIAKKIYSSSAANYDRLASMLCYMNLMGFEKLLKEMDEVYEVFTSPDIGLKINEERPVYDYELSADYFIPTDGSYLLRQISKGKDIVLRYNDIEYKLRSINGILNKEIFDYTKTKVSATSSGAIAKEVFKEELNGYLKRSPQALDEPSKEKLEDWIRQIAKSIESNKNSEVKSRETIELYLKYLVDYPMSTVNQVKDGIRNNGNLTVSDLEQFDDFSFNTFRGWEERFFEVLSSHCFEKFAQRFKRYSPSK